MNKIINIIQSNLPPLNKSSIWVNEGKISTNINGQWKDSDYEAKELIQEFNPFIINISDTSTIESGSTIYEVTNSQDFIDFVISKAQSNLDKINIKVCTNNLIINFTQLELSENTLTCTAVISTGVYSLHLINTDVGGESYFSFTSNE